MAEALSEKRQAGFALVEVLVSLALAALIAVLLVETVRVAGRMTSAVRSEETVEQVQAVRDHLRRTLGSLASRRTDGSLPALQGGADRLTAAVAPDQALERPVELLASLIGVPRPDGGYDFTESRVPLETLQGVAATARAEVLLERIGGFSFRYLGAQAKDLPPSWSQTWTRADRQPDLVEVMVVFMPGDRRSWAPLLIATTYRP